MSESVTSGDGAVVLRGRALEKSFRSGRIDTPILRGLSLDVLAGELTLVSGPSGCGKSTLLALLSGLLRPDAGEVDALGESLWSLDDQALERFRLQHTGFVCRRQACAVHSRHWRIGRWIRGDSKIFPCDAVRHWRGFCHRAASRPQPCQSGC